MNARLTISGSVFGSVMLAGMALPAFASPAITVEAPTATADPIVAIPTSTASAVTGADDRRLSAVDRQSPNDGVPQQLDREERENYSKVFAAIRAERWSDAQLTLDAMRPGLLHPIARAELYLAKNSPRVELPQLMALLGEARELPHAERIARLAKLRGAVETPSLPVVNRLIWQDGAPVRKRYGSAKTDAAATQLATAMAPLIKADDAPGAEALLNSKAETLDPATLTEWQQRVAWMYYTLGRDADARRVAALAQAGTGDFAPLADWVQGLAAWRQNDCLGAQAAFASVAQRARDVEKRSAGQYWASRADMACGRPDLVSARLQSAAQHHNSFYGMLARQALGIQEPPLPRGAKVSEDWKALSHRPNIRVAAALIEIGEDVLASNVIRHQARIGDGREHQTLTRLTGRLGLPSTQIWLTHNTPPGTRPIEEARFPTPNWTPDGGWRVDRSLVYAHALQESRFEARVQSPAGAYGLMQIMPAAASDFGRRRGVTIARDDLSRPSTNMEVGQSYIEQLRDQPFTAGLLPKVIAAYNAGPVPVSAWNAQIQDKGDPLLYIESIPYWETRGYVMTVLRNYWMYEKHAGRDSSSRAAITQGLWPKVPGARGASAVRLTKAPDTDGSETGNY